jgi:hypothetical protein
MGRSKRLLIVCIVVLLAASCLVLLRGQHEKELSDLRDRCEKQARSLYDEDVKADGGLQIIQYKAHYNEAQNKCFYLETVRSMYKDSGATDIESRTSMKWLTLKDLNDKKEYGHFFNNRDDFRAMKCDVADSECHSEKEWENLVKTYVEDSH